MNDPDGRSVPFAAILAACFLGGIGGGAIVGYLLPLTAKAWGAMLVGIIAAFPFFAAVGLALDPPSVHGSLFLITASLSAVFVGGGGGLLAWLIHRAQSSIRR